jgi:hypothetical protein
VLDLEDGRTGLVRVLRVAGESPDLGAGPAFYFVGLGPLLVLGRLPPDAGNLS